MRGLWSTVLHTYTDMSYPELASIIGYASHGGVYASLNRTQRMHRVAAESILFELLLRLFNRARREQNV